MIKTVICLLTVLIAIILSAPVVYADSISQGDSIWLYDREGSTGGGEFGVSKSLNGNEEFRTFCLERQEYFVPGQEFKVGAISENAVNGGVGAQGDRIDTQTAYLYTKFRNQTLSGYDYTPNSAEHIRDADSLQKAIWYFEGEIALPTDDAQAMAWINEANAEVAAGRENNELSAANRADATPLKD